MTNSIKEQYSQMAAIYNKNLKKIKTQLNSSELRKLMTNYNANSDSHLAKILMLRGINL